MKLPIILSATVFGAWLWITVVSATGWRRSRKLRALPADGQRTLPRLSIVVPALNEESGIEPAMRTLLALEYPDFEVIAVDDRSTDETGAILDRLSAEDTRLRVVHVTTLSPGWLGKNHALHAGSQAARGEWILFTDADVHFAPDCLRRAVRYAEAVNLDHLTAYPDIELRGFWETLFVFFFGTIFNMRYQPWKAGEPSAAHYMGIGAFNLVRASHYRKMGGHASLPMDIADDMKLGKRMKESGGRQECVEGFGMVRVRWVEGLRGAILGLEKNAFAGTDFKVTTVLAASAALITSSVWPVAGLFFGPPGARLLCAGTLGMLMYLVRAATPTPGVSPLYGLAFPLGGILFVFIMIRSMVLTLRQGGVIWRGTFYPLADLRKGIV